MDDYDRMRNGVNILQSGGITEITLIDRQFKVLGNTDTYTVTLYQDGRWSCECGDYTGRGKICKHIWACIMKMNLENNY